MSEPEAVVTLPDVGTDRLANAVQAAVMARSPLADELRHGAELSVRGEPNDVATAKRFQTYLELGYLVASADGFAEQERASLAALLEGVTQSAIDHEVLDHHFQDLGDSVQLLGRSQRLARAAADVEAGTGEEAIGLVTLIALADGVLGKDEHQVLHDLGRYTDVPPERVDALIDEAVAQVKERLQ
jgi:tellurite resistance protein